MNESNEKATVATHNLDLPTDMREWAEARAESLNLDLSGYISRLIANDLPAEMREWAEARAKSLGLDLCGYVSRLIELDRSHDLVNVPDSQPGHDLVNARE